MIDAGTTADLTVLSGRIADARILREHHVWEAAKALVLDREWQGVDQGKRRFTALMEADALVDAVLLMTTLAEPKRSVGSISHGGERWICTMGWERNGVGHRFKAEHADLAAALLGSFLQSYQCDREHDKDPQSDEP